jgi:multisubunit Na+/H+ antiporter MnhB subunit
VNRVPSAILTAAVGTVFPLVMVFSLYLLFAGHNQPGGGFAGGMVAAAALSLAYLAGGTRGLHRMVGIPASTVLGGGLLLAMVVALTPMAFGLGFMESVVWEFTLPLVGTVKLVSVLFFDAGVYAVVAGLALLLLEALGDTEGVGA